MLSGLALWQEILLLGLAAISLVYVLYFRIWVALATGSDLVFAASLALAVTSVAWPALFEAASTRLVDRSPLPEALASADQRVAALEALPRELIDRALESLGYERDLEAHDLVARPPGPFESRVRPALEALLTAVLRMTSFACASLLLLTALALRSSTSTTRALQSLTQRVDRLEAPRHSGASA
jgi:hypothetical protein